jgi:formyl-CoA transferase
MIDRPDLIDDPHFTSPENFRDNAAAKEEFDAILLGWLLQHSKQEVMEKAQAAGYMCTAVKRIDEVFEDPQLASRGFFEAVGHPHTGELTYPGAPIKMTETPWRAGRAPLLGEHTAAVLADLGFSDGDVARLRQQGVV